MNLLIRSSYRLLRVLNRALTEHVHNVTLIRGMFVASANRRRDVMNPTGRTKVEVFQEMSASTGALVFVAACVANAGLLVYVTLGRIG